MKRKRNTNTNTRRLEKQLKSEKRKTSYIYLASEKAIVVFTKSSCCMCHSIKSLFYEMGASPAVHELDKESRGKEMEWALRGMGCNPAVPAVFIGGEFVGSARDVISLRVDGSLKLRLINAKAIWS